MARRRRGAPLEAFSLSLCVSIPHSVAPSCSGSLRARKNPLAREVDRKLLTGTAQTGERRDAQTTTEPAASVFRRMTDRDTLWASFTGLHYRHSKMPRQRISGLENLGQSTRQNSLGKSGEFGSKYARQQAQLLARVPKTCGKDQWFTQLPRRPSQKMKDFPYATLTSAIP